jgi:hypothetical protein
MRDMESKSKVRHLDDIFPLIRRLGGDEGSPQPNRRELPCGCIHGAVAVDTCHTTPGFGGVTTLFRHFAAENGDAQFPQCDLRQRGLSL